MVVVRDQASAKLDQIGAKGTAASKKVQDGFKKVTKEQQKTSSAADQAKKSLTEVGSRGAKAMSIVGAGASSVTAALSAAQASSENSEAAFISLAASGATAFATGGPLGLAIAGVSAAIGFIVGSSKEAEEQFNALRDSTTAAMNAARDSARSAADEVERLVAARRAAEGGGDGSRAAEAVTRAQQLRDLNKELRELSRGRARAEGVLLSRAREGSRELLNRVALGKRYNVDLGDAVEAMAVFSDKSKTAHERARAISTALGLSGAETKELNQAFNVYFDSVKALNSKNEEIAARKKVFDEQDKAIQQELDRVLQEKIQVLQTELAIAREKDPLKRAELQFERDLVGLTKEEADLKRQIKAEADSDAGQAKLDAENRVFEILQQQHNARIEQLTLSTDQLQTLREQREVDEARKKLGDEAAERLEIALKANREQSKEKLEALKEEQKLRQETLRLQQEEKRLQETRQRATENVRLEIARIKAEIEGGVEALKEFNDEQERIELRAQGISEAEIIRLQTMRDQLEVIREQRAEQEALANEAEREASGRERSRTASRNNLPGGSGLKGNQSRFGKVFGVSFGGGLASDLFARDVQAAQTSSDTFKRPPPKAAAQSQGAAGPGDIGNAANEVADAGDKAADHAKKIAEFMKKAEQAMKKIERGLEQDEKAAERLRQGVTEANQTLTQLVADNATRTSAMLNSLQQQLDALRRQLEAAQAAAGVLGG